MILRGDLMLQVPPHKMTAGCPMRQQQMCCCNSVPVPHTLLLRRTSRLDQPACWAQVP